MADDSLTDLLSRLVPPDDHVTIRDVSGATVRLDTRLSGRRQILVARCIERLTRRIAVASIVGDKAIKSAETAIDKIVSMLGDDEVPELVADAFRTAYPDACGDTDPLDRFPIEEVVAALAPLAARPFVRLLALVANDADGRSKPPTASDG